MLRHDGKRAYIYSQQPACIVSLIDRNMAQYFKRYLKVKPSTVLSADGLHSWYIRLSCLIWATFGQLLYWKVSSSVLKLILWVCRFLRICRLFGWLLKNAICRDYDSIFPRKFQRGATSWTRIISAWKTAYAALSVPEFYLRNLPKHLTNNSKSQKSRSCYHL